MQNQNWIEWPLSTFHYVFNTQLLNQVFNDVYVIESLHGGIVHTKMKIL